MPTLDEIGSQSQPKGALRDGIEILDTNAVVDFMSYSRVVFTGGWVCVLDPLGASVLQRGTAFLARDSAERG